MWTSRCCAAACMRCHTAHRHVVIGPVSTSRTVVPAFRMKPSPGSGRRRRARSLSAVAIASKAQSTRQHPQPPRALDTCRVLALGRRAVVAAECRVQSAASDLAVPMNRHNRRGIPEPPPIPRVAASSTAGPVSCGRCARHLLGNAGHLLEGSTQGLGLSLLAMHKRSLQPVNGQFASLANPTNHVERL